MLLGMGNPHRNSTSRRSLVVLLVVASSACAQAPPTPSQTIQASDALLVIAEEVEVSAAAAGVLRELRVREGSLLQAGDPLLRVDARQVKLAVSQAKVELQRSADEAKSDVKQRHARKAQELATSEHQRAVKMQETAPSSMSDREIDRLKLAADVAGLEVERAQHEAKMAGYEWRLQQDAYRLAKQELDEHTVSAPISGLVVEVLKRPGEWVNLGDPVVRMVRVDRLRAEAFLPVAEATLDLIGSAAEFRTTLAGGDSIAAAGKVVFVSPKADPVSALARVWIEFPVTDHRLRPGLRGTIQIEPGSDSDDRQVTGAVGINKTPQLLGD